MSAPRLEDLIERYRSAEAAVNAFKGDIEGTTEEAEFGAATDAITNTTAELNTYDGMIAALKLAADECENFHNSEFMMPLLKGMIAYFGNLERVAGGAVRQVHFLANTSDLRGVRDTGFVAIYDAITACIETLDGIVNQPRCGGDRGFNPAGDYLAGLSDYLTYERRRAMEALEAMHIPRGSDPETKNAMLLQWMARDGDMSFAEIAAIATRMEEEQQSYRALRGVARS
ncbi:hypothetical protein [Agrobacterium cavarae]|uniref:hypothetical protein n=1 Tax=Agrobacterium cavarae TaxID=2528239 RepID=UPI002898CE07|nr:hypothetical protein [Agrobacterium cavarae]